MKRRLFIITNTLFPLSFSVFIYLFFRRTPILTYLETNFYKFNILRDKVYIHLSNDNVFFYFIKYYLTDFLWAYVIGFILTINCEFRRLYVVIIIIIVFEIFQLIGILSGTFDILDILFEVFAIIISYVANVKFRFHYFINEKKYIY